MFRDASVVLEEVTASEQVCGGVNRGSRVEDRGGGGGATRNGRRKRGNACKKDGPTDWGGWLSDPISATNVSS